MGEYTLPVDYTKINQLERKKVREQYIEEQEGKCYFCGSSLFEKVPKEVLDKEINWDLFPPFFLKAPIHLQHNHNTGMTEGAVHGYCNAVLWQYHGR